MASAGQVFTESIEVISSTSSGSKSLYFDVQNDGVLITVQRITGDALLTLNLYNELPDPMTEVFIEGITVLDDLPHQGAFSTQRRIRVDCAWNQATEFRLVAKRMSGEGIRQWVAHNTESEEAATKAQFECLLIETKELHETLRAAVNNLRIISGSLEPDEPL